MATKNQAILDSVKLSKMVEDHGLNRVLEMLASHCENRGNLYSAESSYFYDWMRAATNLRVCAEFAFRKPLTIRSE